MLIIEHIETNQIIYQGIYDAHRNHLSCVTCNFSSVTCHFVTFPKLKELETCNFNIIFTMPYVSSVKCQVSHIRCHMSSVTCLLSCVMCHLSCVMCHMLYIYFFTKWLSWLVEALVSTGPTPSSF